MGQMVIEKLKKDCLRHGYGRKKWWADLLGVPPLTLSHWIAGRQNPNGKNSLQILTLLKQVEKDTQGEAWKESLWDAYYSGQPIPSKILSMIILEILSLSGVDSRTLALLSRLIERFHPEISAPDKPGLKNRLGWLMEISGQKPHFAPYCAAGTQTLFKLFPQSGRLKKYLRHYQTPLGKKWRLYDCPLQSIKDSLP